MFDNAQNTLSSFKRGIFLTSGSKKPNSMIIGWGTLGVLWGKPVFFVPVRESRYTKTLIDETGCFTVSVPPEGEMQNAIKICGSKSGRDLDKFQAADMSAVPAKSVASFVVGGCVKHYECRVLAKLPLAKDQLLQGEQKWYRDGDMHTFYIGEIVAEY